MVILLNLVMVIGTQ